MRKSAGRKPLDAIVLFRMLLFASTIAARMNMSRSLLLHPRSRIARLALPARNKRRAIRRYAAGGSAGDL
jgi:hypothetical protein